MENKINFSDAIEGYMLAAQARRLSPNTLNDYQNTFRKFINYLGGDPPIDTINARQIENFLAIQKVSKKTLLNYQIGLSALWTWAYDENIVYEHIVHKTVRIKPEKKAIKPYSEKDIRAMLSVINHSRSYTRPGKKESIHRLPNADRNRAIILLLLDTGIRASELSELKINNIDTRNRTITVFGKGSKERVIPYSARTGQALWKYLASRKEEDVGSNLFISSNQRDLNRHDVRKTLERIGKRAGVNHVNVHKFRHTFAINYLRNGGDPWSLQFILGHSTMDIVKVYLALAQTDIENKHKIASPVDHWRL